MESFVRELRERKTEAAGAERDTAVQHAKGRATARERIEMLFDAGTFSEIDSLVTPRYEHYIGGKASRPGDGV
ncbi:MAG: carboxyl transferase domain-containing protein, partial [Thermoanaerobaculia bacterium]